MPANLVLDSKMVDRMLEISGEDTNKAAVIMALQEFISQREQRNITELFGKLEWDETYDYKAERSRMS